MSEFIRINLNPYKKKTNDCVVRALVAGTFYGYKTVCNMLDVPFFGGSGNIDGVPLENIDEFADKYSLIREYDFELKSEYGGIPKHELDNFLKYYGMSLGFWMDYLKNENGLSRMIFLTKVNPDESQPLGNSTKYHCIYGNVKEGKYYDLNDSGNTIVFGMYTIDPKIVLKKDNPLFFKKEEEKILDDEKSYRKTLKNN